jgi:hypothetical protein
MSARIMETGLVALLLTIWASPAIGNGYSVDVDEDDVRVRVRVGGPPLTGAQQVIEGEIDKLRTIVDRDTGQTRVLARLEVEDDDDYKVWVDLGHPVDLEPLDLEEDDDITVVAAPGWLNGRRILSAQRVADDDELVILPERRPLYRDNRQYDMRRSPELRPRRQPAATDAPSRTVYGRIVDLREVRVEEYGRVLLAEVRTPDDDLVTVDLGRRKDLPEDFVLRKGHRIQAAGVTGRLRDQRVLVADTVTRVVYLHQPAEVAPYGEYDVEVELDD